MTESRSRNGCWTCRLRRRKCDETKPQCRECHSRQLPCHGFGGKPTWMDGGPLEKAELAAIKLAISDKSHQRRRRLRREGTIESTTTADAVELPFEGVVNDMLGDPPMTFDLEGLDNIENIFGLEDGFAVDTLFDSPFLLSDLDNATTSYPFTPITPSNVSDNFADINSGCALPPTPATTAFEPLASDMQLGVAPTLLPVLSLHDSSLLVHYLDHVFPWQFPYLAIKGCQLQKAYMLRLISQSYPLTLAMLALTEWFRQKQTPGKHAQLDIEHDTEELERQYQGALQELRRAMQTRNNGDNDWILATLVMLSYTCLLRNDNNWQTHVNTALQILYSRTPHTLSLSTNSYTQPTPPPTNIATLSQAAKPPPQPSPENQASAFLTSSIIWFHFLAIITNHSPSPLPDSFTHVIHNNRNIDMQNFIGCSIHMLSLILGIHSLYQWKVTAVANKNLDIWDLTHKAAGVRQELDIAINSYVPEAEHELWEIITHIFASAASIYLEIVVNGDVPALPKTRTAVGYVLLALKSLVSEKERSGVCRVVAWPVLVAGSMAEGDVSREFEMALLQAGGMEGVLEILRGVWRIRGEGGMEGGSVGWIEGVRAISGREGWLWMV